MAAVVAQRPHAGTPEVVVVDERVAQPHRGRVVVVDLPPARHAAVGVGAVLAPVDDVRALLRGVPPAAVLGHEVHEGLVVDRGAVAVLRAALAARADVVGRGGPGAAVPRDAQDDPGRADPRRVGADGVRQVVAGARERIHGPGVRGPGGPVVVAHDEDRVRGAGLHRGLQRVVADVPGGVVRELVAGADLVELRANRPQERHELVRVGARQGLEVQVDPVGAAVADGGGRLLREVEARGGGAQERLLDGLLRAGPGEDAQREHDARAVRVRVVDDGGHRRAGPAAPAGGGRPVTVLLAQVALGVGTDREVGDGGQHVVVELGRGARQLPVRQEAEHLAVEPGRGREVEGGRGLGGDVPGAGRGRRGLGVCGTVHWGIGRGSGRGLRLGSGRGGRGVGGDGRPRDRCRRVGRRRGGVGVRRRLAAGRGPLARTIEVRPGGPLLAVGHLVARGSARGQRRGCVAVHRPAVTGARGEPDSHLPAGLEHDLVVRVGHRLHVRDRGLLAGVAPAGHVAGGQPGVWGWLHGRGRLRGGGLGRGDLRGRGRLRGAGRGRVDHRFAGRGGRPGRLEGDRRGHRERAGRQCRDEHGQDERSQAVGTTGSRHWDLTVGPRGNGEARDAGGSGR